MFKRLFFAAVFFVIALPAMAQEQPNFIETSHTVACGQVQITLRNVSPWIYPVSVEIDGVHSYGPTVDNRTDSNGDGRVDLSGPQQDRSSTRTITFAEDTGVHTVRYRVAAGTESDLYRNLPVGQWTEVQVDSDCQPNVVPTTVVITTADATCDTLGRARFVMTGSNETVAVRVQSIPEPYVEGGEVAIYRENYAFGDDETRSFGLSNLEPGLYEITRDGSEALKETFDTEFRISGPVSCEQETEPTTPTTEPTTPTTTPTTETTTPVAPSGEPTTPTTQPEVGGAVDDNTGTTPDDVQAEDTETVPQVEATVETLPFTGPGDGTGLLSVAATALMLLGVITVLSVRRRA